MLNTVNLNSSFLVVTLFCDLPEINWFAVTYFRDQDPDYLKITREMVYSKKNM